MKFHWTIQAYENIVKHKDPEKTDILNGVVEITINSAIDEKDALRKAAEVIQRPFYRICRIYQCHECGGISDKIKEETLKSMKKHNEDNA